MFEQLHIFHYIILVAVFCAGLHGVTRPGRIWEGLVTLITRKRKKVKMRPQDRKISSFTAKGDPIYRIETPAERWQVVPVWIRKPLIVCITCMPSLWGVLIVTGMTCTFDQGPDFWAMLAWRLALVPICASYLATWLWEQLEPQE